VEEGLHLASVRFFLSVRPGQVGQRPRGTKSTVLDATTAGARCIRPLQMPTQADPMRRNRRRRWNIGMFDDMLHDWSDRTAMGLGVAGLICI